MARHDMPFLMLNLGVEMIFVLHSRLRAQAVSPDKAEGVMCDIGSNLFSDAFVSELFTPQPLYTPASVMQVFSVLSNSSVMHLSENSMKKLYDLVFMTVKYQILTLRHPLELFELTLNHLDSVLRLVPSLVQPLVRKTTERVHSLAAAFSVGDWANVRRSLLNFFGGRHVRVSVFLENNVQSASTGAFYIPKDTYLSPSPACPPPGVIRFFTTSTSPSVSVEGRFDHPDAQLPYPPTIPLNQWDPTNPATRMTTNGFDMYAGSTPTASPTSAAAAGGFSDPLGRQTREMPSPPRSSKKANSTNNTTDDCVIGGPISATSADALTQAKRQQAYDAELSYLAMITGAANRAPGVHTFELELFDEPAVPQTAAQATTTVPAEQPASTVPQPHSAPQSSSTSSVVAAVPVSRMSLSTVQEQNRKLLGIMNDFEDSKKDGTQNGGASPTAVSNGVSDLLDILDEI